MTAEASEGLANSADGRGKSVFCTQFLESKAAVLTLVPVCLLLYVAYSSVFSCLPFLVTISDSFKFVDVFF